MRTTWALATLAALVALAGCVSTHAGSRPPTRAEREDLARAEMRYLGLTSARCMTFDIAISHVDDHYARVNPSFHAPFSKSCLPSNGESLFKRTAAGWRFVEGGSDALPCGYLGVSARVLRSLFGSCGDR